MRHHLIYILTAAVMAAGCQTHDAPFNPQPELSVADATGITRTEATIKGTMEDNGGNGLTDLHFEWWQADGTISASPLLSAQNGEVEYTLRDLKPGGTYCYRLKGDNGRTNMTSGTKQFQTMPNVIPTISQLYAIAKGPASMIASFRIEDNGGEDIIEAGCHIRNINREVSTKQTADISKMTDNTVYIIIKGLDKNADMEITPFAVNTIGEAKGTPMIVSTTNSIYLSEAGMLDKLTGDSRMNYTSLSFSGFMNGDDIRTLREMAGMDINGNGTEGQLTHIDLTDADFVEGGSSYIPSRYMSDNVVGYGMFQKLHRLKSIQLPNSVTAIEEQAFLDCDTLTSITIPARVTSVIPSDGCTSLAEISVSPANRNYKSIDGVLFNAGASSLLWFPIGKEGEYTLPSSVTAIGDYAFRNCRITHFTIPDNVTEIGKAIFFNSSVRSVRLSDNITTIPQATFQSCTSLTEIHLGSATGLIGNYAFDGCPLTDIYLPATVPPVCYSSTFSSSYNLLRLCRLHVPEGSIQRYKSHPAWGKFENISK